MPDKKNFKLASPQMVVTAMLVLPAWGLVFSFPTNESLIILGTNILMLVGGFWLGSSLGSQSKRDIPPDILPPAKSCCKEDVDATHYHDHPVG
jgi:hypothetical protein